MRHSRTQKLSPSNSTSTKVESCRPEKKIVLDQLTSPVSLSFNNETANRVAKRSKTFGLVNLDNYCAIAQSVVSNVKSTKQRRPIQINFQDFSIESTECPQEKDFFVQQFVGAATIGGTNETVLCQMIQDRVASTRKNCADISKKVVRDVIKGTPMLKSGKRLLHYEIVYENLSAYSKMQWIDPMEPYRTAFIDNDSGKLHIVSKEFIASSKSSCLKELHYCQTIEPQYLRNVLFGNIVPPTCRRPSTYNKRGLPISNNWRCPTYSYL